MKTKRVRGKFRTAPNPRHPYINQIDGVGWSRVCINGTGIGVWFIVSRFVAGETIAELAKDYLRSEAEIEGALRIFLDALPGKHGEKVERTMREIVHGRGV